MDTSLRHISAVFDPLSVSYLIRLDYISSLTESKEWFFFLSSGFMFVFIFLYNFLSEPESIALSVALYDRSIELPIDSSQGSKRW